MKKLLLIIIVLTCNLLSSQAEMQNLTKDKYSISFPYTWSLDTSKLMGTEFILFAPSVNTKDNFSENINFIIQNLEGKGIDMKTYLDISIEQIKGMTSDKMIESFEFKQNGDTYHQLTYTWTYGKNKLRVTSILTIKHEKAYLLTLTTKVKTYDLYKAEASKIMSSLKIID